MDTIFSLSPLVLASIPVTLGLVEAIKQVGLPSRFAPLLSIAIGCGLAALAGASGSVIIAQGILIGLSASGLFSGSKATFQG